jgi:hypothetical protein
MNDEISFEVTFVALRIYAEYEYSRRKENDRICNAIFVLNEEIPNQHIEYVESLLVKLESDWMNSEHLRQIRFESILSQLQSIPKSLICFKDLTTLQFQLIEKLPESISLQLQAVPESLSKFQKFIAMQFKWFRSFRVDKETGSSWCMSLSEPLLEVSKLLQQNMF